MNNKFSVVILSLFAVISYFSNSTTAYAIDYFTCSATFNKKLHLIEIEITTSTQSPMTFMKVTDYKGVSHSEVIQGPAIDTVYSASGFQFYSIENSFRIVYTLSIPPSGKNISLTMKIPDSKQSKNNLLDRSLTFICK